MIKREFYNCVIEMTKAEGIENIKFENEELTVKGVAEYAIAQITALDETNEKRRNAVSKKALEKSNTRESSSPQKTQENPRPMLSREEAGISAAQRC